MSVFQYFRKLIPVINLFGLFCIAIGLAACEERPVSLSTEISPTVIIQNTSIVATVAPAIPEIGQHIEVSGLFVRMFGESYSANGTITPADTLLVSNEQSEWTLDVEPKLLASLGSELYNGPKYITVEGEVLPERTIKVTSIRYVDNK